MSSRQQHDYNYLENETVLLQKEQLIKQNSRSARLVATGKVFGTVFLCAYRSRYIPPSSGRRTSTPRLGKDSTAYHFHRSATFSDFQRCPAIFLRYSAPSFSWKRPNCDGELPLLTMPRTFLRIKTEICTES